MTERNEANVYDLEEERSRKRKDASERNDLKEIEHQEDTPQTAVPDKKRNRGEDTEPLSEKSTTSRVREGRDLKPERSATFHSADTTHNRADTAYLESLTDRSVQGHEGLTQEEWKRNEIARWAVKENLITKDEEMSIRRGENEALLEELRESYQQLEDAHRDEKEQYTKELKEGRRKEQIVSAVRTRVEEAQSQRDSGKSGKGPEDMSVFDFVRHNEVGTREKHTHDNKSKANKNPAGSGSGGGEDEPPESPGGGGEGDPPEGDPEKELRDYREAVASATTFEELYDVLRRFDGIEISTEPLDSEYYITRCEEIRTATKATGSIPEEKITDYFILEKEKILELLQRELMQGIGEKKSATDEKETTKGDTEAEEKAEEAFTEAAHSAKGEVKEILEETSRELHIDRSVRIQGQNIINIINTGSGTIHVGKLPDILSKAARQDGEEEKQYEEEKVKKETKDATQKSKEKKTDREKKSDDSQKSSDDADLEEDIPKGATPVSLETSDWSPGDNGNRSYGEGVQTIPLNEEGFLDLQRERAKKEAELTAEFVQRKNLGENARRALREIRLRKKHKDEDAPVIGRVVGNAVYKTLSSTLAVKSIIDVVRGFATGKGTVGEYVSRRRSRKDIHIALKTLEGRVNERRIARNEGQEISIEDKKTFRKTVHAYKERIKNADISKAERRQLERRLGEILAVRKRKQETAVLEHDRRVTRALESHLDTKSRGIEITKDVLNTLLTVSGFVPARAALYSTAAIAERGARAEKIREKETLEAELYADLRGLEKEIELPEPKAREKAKTLLLDGLRETLRDFKITEVKTGKEKSAKVIRALGSLARAYGILRADYEGSSTNIFDKLLSSLEERGIAGTAAANFRENAERIFRVFGIDKLYGMGKEASLGDKTKELLENTFGSTENTPETTADEALVEGGTEFPRLSTEIPSAYSPKVVLGEKESIKTEEISGEEDAVEMKREETPYEIHTPGHPDSTYEFTKEETRLKTFDEQPPPGFQGGEHVWGEIGNQFEARGWTFEDEALKTHAVDYLKDKIVSTPEAYGLSNDVDPDVVTKEQLEAVDWDKLLREGLKDDEFSRMVPDLTIEQKSNILENNRMLNEYVSKTGTSIDSETVDQLIRDIREEKGDVDRYLAMERDIEAYEKLTENEVSSESRSGVARSIRENGLENAIAERLIDTGSTHHDVWKKLSSITEVQYKEAYGEVAGNVDKLSAERSWKTLFLKRSNVNELWNIIWAEPATKAVRGEWSDAFTNEASTNDTSNLLHYVKVAEEAIGRPYLGESMGEYLTRYEATNEFNLEKPITIASATIPDVAPRKEPAGATEMIPKKITHDNSIMRREYPGIGSNKESVRPDPSETNYKEPSSSPTDIPKVSPKSEPAEPLVTKHMIQDEKETFKREFPGFDIEDKKSIDNVELNPPEERSGETVPEDAQKSETIPEQDTDHIPTEEVSKIQNEMAEFATRELTHTEAQHITRELQEKINSGELKVPKNGYVVYVNKNHGEQYLALLRYDNAANQFSLVGADNVSTASPDRWGDTYVTPEGVHTINRIGDAAVWGKPYGSPGHEVYDLSEDSGIAFHPTNEKDLLGKPASHGCIRMTDRFNDLLDKYNILDIKSPVVVGSFAKESLERLPKAA